MILIGLHLSILLRKHSHFSAVNAGDTKNSGLDFRIEHLSVHDGSLIRAVPFDPKLSRRSYEESSLEDRTWLMEWRSTGMQWPKPPVCWKSPLALGGIGGNAC